MSQVKYPSPTQITAANAKLIELVRIRLPERFYKGEKWWTMYCTAALVRMADTVESLMALMPARLDLDAQTLLRSLYEQAVTLAWVMIDPVEGHRRWEGEAKVQIAKLHNDALTFGEKILSDSELADAQTQRGLPKVPQMALDADKHWATRVKGLHPPGHPLSFRGLYLSIYRLGSRPAHGSFLSLEPYVVEDQENQRFVVDRAKPGPILWYALVAPLFSIALVIGAQHFKWLDEDKIRQIAEKAQ
jgi:hypothetical protein